MHKLNVQMITAAKTKLAKQNLELNCVQIHYPSEVEVLCSQCMWSTWPLAQFIHGNSYIRGY